MTDNQKDSREFPARQHSEMNRRLFVTGVSTLAVSGCAGVRITSGQDVLYDSISSASTNEYNNSLGAASMIRALWSSAEMDFSANSLSYVSRRIQKRVKSKMVDRVHAEYDKIIRRGESPLGIYVIIPPSIGSHSTILNYKIFDSAANMVNSGTIKFVPKQIDEYYVGTIDQIAAYDSCGRKCAYSGSLYKIGIEPISGNYLKVWDDAHVQNRRKILT